MSKILAEATVTFTSYLLQVAAGSVVCNQPPIPEGPFKVEVSSVFLLSSQPSPLHVAPSFFKKYSQKAQMFSAIIIYRSLLLSPAL